MNDTDQTQQPAQEPTVNGVPVKDLPAYAQRLFDKVMALREKQATLQTQAVQNQGALEEVANLLAAEVDTFKASAAPTPIPSQPA